jgi:cytochrome c
MSDLQANKIIGAVLATGLVILGLQEVSSILFHAEGPETPGYAIEVQEEAAGGAQAELPPDWGTVLPAADVAAGETAWGKCVSCHTDTPGGAEMTGPNLYNLIGRKPGGHAGYTFSSAMVDYGNANPTWTYENLNEFLEAPAQHIRGTKMTFVGLKRVEDRINILAYFRTMAPSPPPIPAPNPVAETATTDGAVVGADGVPTAAAEGAPAISGTESPTGQTPDTGAAATPAVVTSTPGDQGR